MRLSILAVLLAGTLSPVFAGADYSKPSMLTVYSAENLRGSNGPVLYSFKPEFSQKRALSVFDPDGVDVSSYTINPKSVRIEISEAGQPVSCFPYSSLSKAGVTLALDQVVNITLKIWDIIVANKPVVNVADQYATAVPQGVATWTMLSGWQAPKAYTYHFYCSNLYGARVVDVKYMISYTYGGGYNGKGKYLTGVNVQPLNVEVLWGYNYAMSAEVPDTTVVNAGTVEEPLAALQMTLKYTISTPVKYSQGRHVSYIRGDGYYQQLGADK